MESFAGRKIGITDTTLRDSHQSLLATRMKTDDMLPVAAQMDEMAFTPRGLGWSYLDTCMRFWENPWERLRL